jgi:hypothetical protein
MYENDLANLSNWTGIVEDYDDPLKTGRLRVRINGFHNINKTILPTKDLPWAMVALPVNGSTTLTGPKVGDWVIGFFFDGQSAQLPVVTHVLPGINTVVVKQPTGAPQMPAGEIYDRPGQPSLPPLGRGVVQFTAIDTSNRRRAHVCDISYEVDQTVGAMKNLYGPVVDAIRKLINLVIGTSNFDPTGVVKQAIELARQVVRFIKDVTTTLKKIQETIDDYLTVLKKISAMITYLRSLPERALAFLTDCLGNLYKSLRAGFTSLFAFDGDSGLFGEVGELLNTISEGVDAVTEATRAAASIAATPQKIAAIIATPTSAAEAAAAGKQVEQLISDAGVPASPIEVGAGP